jgi:hypothetical protein
MDIYPSHRRRFDLQVSDDEGEHAVSIPVEVLFEWDGGALNWSLEQYHTDRWRNPKHNPELAAVLRSVLRQKLHPVEVQCMLEDHPEYA